MDQVKPWVVAVMGVVVIVLIAMVLILMNRKTGQNSPAAAGVTGQGKVGTVVPKGEDIFRPENEKALATVEGGTREKVQEQIATPNENAVNVPKNVAVPTTVVESSVSAFRHFDLSANGNVYSPNTIVVNEGDVVDVSFTPGDKSYDVSFPDFGIYRAAQKGQLTHLQFEASHFGEYKFLCANTCGSAKVEGKLVVNKK